MFIIVNIIFVLHNILGTSEIDIFSCYFDRTKFFRWANVQLH